MTTTTPSASNHLPASEFILQSFNLLDTNVASDLSQIVNNLKDIRVNPLPPDYYENFITEQTSDQMNTVTFSVCKTHQESFTDIAASFGVSGSFGFYSGSVQSSLNKQQSTSATSFTSSAVGVINTGTTYYNQKGGDSIFSLLVPGVKSTLQNIQTVDDAKNFVEKYGTHIALGWNLGGCYSIQIEADSSSYSNKEQLKTSATAKYSGVSTVSASITTAYQINQSGSQYNLKETVFTAGGSAAFAGQIDPNNQQTINSWINTCTPQTTYGIYKMKSFADIAEANNMTSQAQILQKYFDLCILAYSLQNPVVYSAEINLTPYQTNTVNVVADMNFKIVSGGAKLDQDVSSWLVNSYPLVAGSSINSWVVGSHDVSYPASSSNYLAGYAIAVYDPGNLLQVTVQSALGANTGIGGDQFSVPLPPNYVLTGGGCQVNVIQGINLKYIMGSYPSLSAPWNWTGVTCDYLAAAQEVQSTFYAVGICCDGLTITPTVVYSANGTKQNHGNQTTVLGNGLNLIGGGASIDDCTGGDGNFLQMSYPLSNNTWAEYNKDTDGNVTFALSNAYAIGLSVSIDGLSDQPAMLVQN